MLRIWMRRFAIVLDSRSETGTESASGYIPRPLPDRFPDLFMNKSHTARSTPGDPIYPECTDPLRSEVYGRITNHTSMHKAR